MNTSETVTAEKSANVGIPPEPAKSKVPCSTASGAYVETGPREYQLYASVPKSDALVAVLELDAECPGQVHHFFIRGGIEEGRFTVDELQRGITATFELLRIARDLWPTKMKVRKEET